VGANQNVSSPQIWLCGASECILALLGIGHWIPPCFPHSDHWHQIDVPRSAKIWRRCRCWICCRRSHRWHRGWHPSPCWTAQCLEHLCSRRRVATSNNHRWSTQQLVICRLTMAATHHNENQSHTKYFLHTWRQNIFCDHSMVYIPSTAICSTYHATGSAQLANRLLPWLIRQFGTPILTISDHLTLALAVLGIYRKSFCLYGIRTFRALAVYYNDALYKSIFTLHLYYTTHNWSQHQKTHM